MNRSRIANAKDHNTIIKRIAQMQKAALSRGFLQETSCAAAHYEGMKSVARFVKPSIGLPIRFTEEEEEKKKKNVNVRTYN